MNDARWRYAEWLIIEFNTRNSDRASHDFIIVLKKHGIRLCSNKAVNSSCKLSFTIISRQNITPNAYHLNHERSNLYFMNNLRQRLSSTKQL